MVTQLCPGPVATEFEEVAGNTTGHKAPSFVELQPRDCASAGLAAFRRGAAMCVPGLLARLVIGIGRLTPRWLTRLALGPLSGGLRRQIERSAAA